MPLPDPQTINSYGGAKEQRRAVVSPIHSVSAPEHNSVVSDLAMVSRMAPRGIVRFVTGTPPTDPSVGVVHESMWGKELADKPVVTSLGANLYRVTWPTEVENELGESVTLNLRWATVSCGKKPVLNQASCEVTGPNTVDVGVFTAGGASDSSSGVIIQVMVY